ELHVGDAFGADLFHRSDDDDFASAELRARAGENQRNRRGVDGARELVVAAFAEHDGGVVAAAGAERLLDARRQHERRRQHEHHQRDAERGRNRSRFANGEAADVVLGRDHASLLSASTVFKRAAWSAGTVDASADSTSAAMTAMTVVLGSMR